MLFQYFCKKNGQNIELEVESLPSVSMEYIVKKGLREYFDNYHASVTKDGMKTAKGTTPWTSQDEYLATVKEYLTEAFDRLRAGDVASGRQPADPKVAEARRQVAELAKVSATPEELAAAIAFINKQREKAGQGIAGKAQSKAA